MKGKKLSLILIIMLLGLFSFWACGGDESKDETNPTVSILSPENDDMLNGIITITAEANDNEGVNRVEFYFDDANIGNAQTSPYSITYDLSTLENGSSHTIYAIAFDDAGNSTQSETVNITINVSIVVLTLSSSSITDNSCVLTWTGYDGIGLYLLKTSTSSDITISTEETDTISPLSDTVFTKTGLDAETQYYFKVYAVDGSGTELANSNVLPVTTTEASTMDTAMVYIPTSTYTRGCVWDGSWGDNDNLYSSRITITEFYIDKYEVTYGQYQEFVDAGGYETEDFWSEEGWSYRLDMIRAEPENWSSGTYRLSENHPVIGVSYWEAEAYANWAGKRLPTEAEWELAARGTEGEDVDHDSYPDGYKWPWGDDFHADDEVYCNYKSHDTEIFDGYDDGYELTSPVGAFPNGDSPYGVSDMAGNVYEWCSDWWALSYYEESPSIDPQGPATGDRKIIRGGSFLEESDPDLFYGFDLRTYMRNKTEPGDQQRRIGFRCAKDVD